MKFQKLRKLLVVSAALTVATSAFAGCSKTEPVPTPTTEVDKQSEEQPASEEKTLSGEIVVLTNRTDKVDTDFVEYTAKFNEKYPDVKVSYEAMTDYEGQTKVRMNTEDYGDVLLIPNDIAKDELGQFFEPLGTLDEMSQKYQFVTEKAYDGVVYGIPLTINAQGIVYNKAVFEQAGITTLPKTPEEYIAAMKQIQEKTDAIPYYTNYAAGWTLTQWEGITRGIFGDAEYSNKMVHMDEPFAEGTAHHIVYGLMYDLIKEGVIEDDPFTSDWEMSKQMLADGKIATMPLGSWAISQVQALAADPSTIGYMPFPYTAEDGKVYSAASGDYKLAVNKNSKNKEAALAFLYFFLEDSGFVEKEGGISAVKGRPMPETLKAFEELGVILLEEKTAPAGEEGLLDAVDKESEVGLWNEAAKKRMVESAVGNTSETFEDICADLNAKWASAKANLVK
nr:ABC transporter substrate-binding protein [uncultured Niameybacter sp.]